MAKITLTYKTTTPRVINIPDAAIPQIIDGFAILGNYQDKIERINRDENGNVVSSELINNPETKSEFFFKNFSNQIEGLLRQAHAEKAKYDTLTALETSYQQPAITQD